MVVHNPREEIYKNLDVIRSIEQGSTITRDFGEETSIRNIPS